MRLNNKMFRSKIALIFSISLLIVSILPDQGFSRQAVNKMTLENAINIALENNYTIRAQKEKLSASDWSVKSAYSEYLPKVSLNQRLTRVDDTSVRYANFAIEGVKQIPGMEDVDIPPVLFKDTHASTVGVTMPLFTGGLLKSSLETAKIAKASDELTLTDNEKEITLQVTRAYFEYIKSLEFLKVRQTTLEQSRSNLKNVKAKNELGLRPKSDILRWEAQEATDESSVIEAMNGAAISRISLANVMGIPLIEEFEVEMYPEEEFNRLIRLYNQAAAENNEQKLTGMFSTARQNNPGLQTISLQKELNRTSIKLARSQFLPQVSLSYNYSWQANDTPDLDGFKSWDATINLTYSLFNGFGDLAQVNKARAELRQAESIEEDYGRNLDVSVFTAYNNLKTALARIRLAEKNLIQAMDNMQLIRNRYNLGLASNIDQIDAQVLETTAEVNLISAKYDLLISGAELDRALGTRFLDNR
ncbi:MAG: TolC family protein [bacterium]|nr:TolC family protein [bacterium]